MGRFLEELKRRKVDRVVIAYLAVVWLVLQVAETLLPAYGFSDVAIRNMVAVFGIGLVVTAMLSWSFEWTPEGIFKDSTDRPSSATTGQNTKVLDRFIIASLTIAVAFFAIDKFVIDPGRDAQDIQAAAEQARADALASANSDQSVAVLPFANRSNRDDDVYFVDGIHDDILTQLAHINALGVTSRTSVEQYRGTTQTISEIGAALGVTAILEGGVQRAGDRVRINVQLINASNDDHLWAETYERELTAANIFSVQADIAAKVADALRAALLPEEQIILAETPTESYEAYDLYLLGRYHWNQRTKESVDLAVEYFEQAIEADPEFVLALSGLADSYIFQVVFGTVSGSQAYPLAEEVIERAMALDDESSEVWASSGLLNRHLRKYAEAQNAFHRALDLDPKNSAAWFWYSQLLWLQDRYADALAALQTAYTLEPMSHGINRSISGIYRHMGDFKKARMHLQRADQVAPSQSLATWESIVGIYYWSGEFSRAVEETRRHLSSVPDDLDGHIVLMRINLALGNIEEAKRWVERGTSLTENFRHRYRTLRAEGDFTGAIADLEETLELHQPRRELWVLFELFSTHFHAGDEASANAYLKEYVDGQQGRLEVRPDAYRQLDNLMAAAFWILHGDDELSEPDRGRELAEEIRSKITALTELGWLHPQMFASLAAANALLGDHDDAIANLNEAIDSGYRNQQSSLENPAFDSLRSDPRFADVGARIQELIDEDNRRLASIELPPYAPPVQHEVVSLTREQLEDYEGWYSDRNVLVHVFITNDGQIMGTVGPNPPVLYHAISEVEVFDPANPTYTVVFHRDDNGVVTHFIYKGGFGEVLFKAVDDPPATIELPRDVLASYEGAYSHDRLGDLEGERAESDIWSADIYVDDEGLIWIDFDDQPKLEIRAVTETEFDQIGFDSDVVFLPDPETGLVDSFIITQDGREHIFHRD